MILYLDTSSLVKLYLQEEDSEAVVRWTEQAEVVATSIIALPEAVAALARRRREGDLDEADLTALRTALQGDWPSYAIVDVDAEAAADLALRHPLRGLDAIHVAAALTLGAAAEVEAAAVAFSSFDHQQTDVARREGLSVLVPGDDLMVSAALA